MGTSKKWLKTIVSRKKSPQAKNADSEAALNKKQSSWNLWKSCRVIDKGSTLGGDDDDETSVENGIGVSSSSSRAPRIIISQADQEEWAAICIQTAFRGVLARRALRALKGLVRLQAAINGQCVRKQSNGSLRSIQAFVRVRARIHAHRVLKNKEGQGVPQIISCNTVEARPTETEEGWCDSIGTVEEIQARLQQRQEAAIKRERAMAYAFSNQWRANSKLNIESLFDYELDNSTWSWIWLDHWISSQPSEGHFSNPNSKQDAQTVEDSAGNNFRLKNSAALNIKKAVNSKVDLDTSKGNHSSLARARSRSHGTDSRLQKAPSSIVSKPYAKKQAPKPSVEQSSRQWRSFSNPKQWPNKDVKRRNSLPNPVQKSATLQNHQSAVHDQGSHYMLDPEEDRKEDTIEIQEK